MTECQFFCWKNHYILREKIAICYWLKCSMDLTPRGSLVGYHIEAIGKFTRFPSDPEGFVQPKELGTLR